MKEGENMKTQAELIEKLTEIQVAILGATLLKDKELLASLNIEARALLWVIGKVDWDGNKL